jgi:hypothetical protein
MTVFTLYSYKTRYPIILSTGTGAKFKFYNIELNGIKLMMFLF